MTALLKLVACPYPMESLISNVESAPTILPHSLKIIVNFVIATHTIA